jgi:hypothetical protein
MVLLDTSVAAPSAINPRHTAKRLDAKPANDTRTPHEKRVPEANETIACLPTKHAQVEPRSI